MTNVWFPGSVNDIVCDYFDANTVIYLVTVEAGSYVPSPAWSALILAVPALCNIIKFPEIVTTPEASEVYVTAKPEDAVASNEI